MGYLGATLTQVFTRAGRINISLRDATIAQMGNGASKCEWSVRRISGILKKVSRVENWTPNEKGWLSLARGGLGQVSHKMGNRWKSQNRKNVYLSPYVEEPLNSKVIKSFVPELRSCYVFFSCFEIPMFYVYIYEGGCPRGVMVKAMDCGIVVSEFVLQSRYYIHFRANTLGKGMDLLILPAMS